MILLLIWKLVFFLYISFDFELSSRLKFFFFFISFDFKLEWKSKFSFISFYFKLELFI